jgi:hypothetical protein
MRRLCSLLLLFGVCRIAAAQQPYPVAQQSPPVMQPTPSPWGGYALPAQVPYQPVLENGQPPAGAGAVQAWQPYPTTTAPPMTGVPDNAVILDGPMPPAAHELAPDVPLYPGTTEPSLRESLTPADARNGFFQKVRLAADYIPSLGSDSLGWTDVRTEVVTAIPFFTRENPIIITPSYELHFLDSPAGFDLPERLNDIAIDFHVFRVFGNHWIADFAVTPGLFADDHSLDSSDALRVNGRAVGVYAPTIDLKYALGVTYVDGGWSKIVPVAGVIYKPNDDVEYTLVFPTPKIAWRLPWSPIPGRDERWMYVAIDYGNSAWAFQQSNGTQDVLSSRDYRLLLGFERKTVGGCSHRFEIGYVFNRDIKIASISGNDISMNDSLIVRAGISY